MATPVDNSIGFTGNPQIDALTQGSSWQFGGGAHTLSYSFSLNDNPAGGAWTGSLANAARQAFTEWSNVANITFVESGNGTVFTQSSADIAVTLTGDELGSSVAGFGIFPSPTFVNTILAATGYTRADYPRPEGDIFFDNYYSGFSYLSQGEIGLGLMLHEIGHALGLKHPHDNGGGSHPTFSQAGLGAYDSTHYTVMSYTDPYGNSFSSHNPVTPMLFDILAIQTIYGANMSYRTGNDTYGLNDSGVTTARAIWDAGGTDTIDASGLVFGGLTIDLRPGGMMHYGTGTTVIAYGVTIENAVGSNFNDTIIGNDAANFLNGGMGSDFLSGGLSDDTYVVDNFSDTVIEMSGQGTDTVLSFVSFALPSNVENLTLAGSSSVNGTGNSLNNVILGNAGTNVLTGGLGNDTYGVDNAGDSVVESASEGTDLVLASVSHSLNNNVENLLLTGSSAINGTGNGLDNIIYGNSAANSISGGLGNDTLYGQGGLDVLAGADGHDTYLIDAGDADTVVENFGEGTDTVRSGGTYSLGANVENLTLTGSGNSAGTGNLGNNVITGNVGANLLDGGGGNDTFFGVGGRDTLNLSQARGSYQLDFHHGTVVVSDGGNTQTLHQVETLHYNDAGPDQTVGAWYLESANDADGDGHGDVYFRDPAGYVALWQMGNGVAMPTGAGLAGFPGVVIPAAWHIDAKADFNGDGTADLMFRNVDSGQTYGWLMNGQSAIGSGFAGYGGAPASWHIRGAADFSGDGKADLLWQSDTGQAYIWNMDGLSATGGGFAYHDANGNGLTIPTEWQVKGTGDFNGDGYGDILWRNANTGQVFAWLMKGTDWLTNQDGSPAIGFPGPGSIPLEWQVSGTGDFNADGKSDILWHNAQNGDTYLWEMDGLALASGHYEGYQHMPPEWKIADVADVSGDQRADIIWQTASGAVVITETDSSPAPDNYQVISGAPSNWLIV